MAESGEPKLLDEAEPQQSTLMESFETMATSILGRIQNIGGQVQDKIPEIPDIDDGRRELRNLEGQLVDKIPEIPKIEERKKWGRRGEGQEDEDEDDDDDDQEEYEDEEQGRNYFEDTGAWTHGWDHGWGGFKAMRKGHKGRKLGPGPYQPPPFYPMPMMFYPYPLMTQPPKGKKGAPSTAKYVCVCAV